MKDLKEAILSTEPALSRKETSLSEKLSLRISFPLSSPELNFQDNLFGHFRHKSQDHFSLLASHGVKEKFEMNHAINNENNSR